MSTPGPSRENTGAVIVTYHPDAELRKRAGIVVSQVDRLVLVDNGSETPSIGMLRDLARGATVDLIENPENRGVAAGLNAGLKWAVEHGYEWLLTLDQDTVIDEDVVPAYVEVYESSQSSNIALIGANYIDNLTGVAFIPSEAFEGRAWMNVPGVITSGSLLCVQAARSVGPFRDEFFIDDVDYEYCLRCRAAGFDVLISREALMQHTVGFPERRRFLGKNLIAPNLEAFRQYYMTRNHIVLMREHFKRERPWVLGLLRSRIKELVLILLLERRKAAKLRYAVIGLIDGVRGKLGPLRDREHSVHS